MAPRASSSAAAAAALAVRRQELRTAVADCRERGLAAAARWAAQQLVALPGEGGVGPSGARQVAPAAHESDAYQLARSCFDLKEYRAAAAALRGAPGPKALFLRCYSTYLAGERRREQERLEGGVAAAGGAAAAAPPNSELPALEAELRGALAGGGGDAFVQYLLGLVLVDREALAEARQVLCASVGGSPWNWSAWQALQAACPDGEAAATLPLPDHPAARLFRASLAVELHRGAEALEILAGVARELPRSEAVVALAAAAHYSLQNFDEAQELYEQLLAADPSRVEGMDTYSNILYVKEDSAGLSHLAHRLAAGDKYRPETCCVVGNYYSLKGSHEKAVQYFRRALRLDPGYLSAWTLMGHEYVEMKNPPAAIEAYRRAVDVSPRDYRAWYGLGQAYELVAMPHHALYYFRRATALRPTDARMWNAMGHCYQAEPLGALRAAARCHARALPHDREGVAVHELAKLHAALGEADKAAHYHRLNLTRVEAEAGGPGGAELAGGSDAIEALSFLAGYHQERGELEIAEEYYARLLDTGAASKEAAKAALREIRAQRAAGGDGGAGAGGGLATPGMGEEDMGISP